MSEDFLKGNDRQAAEIAAGVMKLVRGELDTKFDAMMSKYMARVEEMEKERQKYEADREIWFTEQLDKANKLRPTTESDKQRIAVQTQEIFRQAREEVVSESAVTWTEYQRKIANEPRETITSGGKPIHTSQGIKFEPEIISFIVGTRPVKYILYPGVPTEVPKSVADMYRQRYQQKRKLDELGEALDASNMKEFGQVARRFPEIDPSRSINPEDIANSVIPKGE